MATDSSRADAERRLNEYLGEVERLCRQRGEDPSDVVEGLRAHVEAELCRIDGGEWDLVKMERALSVLGTPEEVVGGEGSDTPAARLIEEAGEDVRARGYGKASGAILMFAVAIPLIAICVELMFALMATFYLDPMPTWVHVVALLGVVAGIVVADRALWRPGFFSRRPGLVFLANAYALGLSAIYFVVYLPMLPVSAMGVLAIGLGLLGFSPLACMLASFYQWRLLRRNGPEGYAPRNRRKWSAAGVVLAVAILVVGNAPDILRGHALNRAALDDSELGWRGLRMLNLLHADAYVLLACYEPRSLSDGEEGARGPVLEPLRPVLAVLAPDNPPVETCRRVYYELTGQLYNSVPAPRLRNFRARRDSGLGGSEVAGNVPGLSMVSSGMEVQVDWPDSPTAYVEWVMEFEKRGDPTDPGEARVQIMLPHGAVVSRLTLWIDGEERESAVGFRQQVREAYKSVAVVQRRDPALVSYVGPDRVLLQVFPVTPGRPPMKVKLGISAPLVFRDGKGWLRLPHIVERNLAVPEKLEHAVWAQAGVPLHGSESLQAGPAVDGSGHSLHGKLGANDILDCETGTIWLDAVAAAGTYAGRFENVEATLEMTPNAAPSVGEAILVVDGSKSMAGARIDWRKAVAAIPPEVSVKAFYSRAKEWDTPYKSQGASQRAGLGEWLAAKKPGGGSNPARALEAAFEEAQSKQATIVWIHGPQPVTMPGGQSLEQWASHSTSRLIDVQVIPGPNRFVERLDRALGEETAPLLGSAMETVLYVLRTLQTEDVERRYRVATAEKAAENAARPHVVRLAIADAVGRANPVERPRLARLAADARLVTTATSAVVLENRAQYEAHDLDPSANPEWIPAVPEPEEWALLALAALCAVAVFYRKRRLAPQG